jgi:hypothetical protein
MKKILLLGTMVVMTQLLNADVIKDSDTGLLWQDNSDAKTIKKDWYDAKEYCKGLTLNGESNWRLPSRDELVSLKKSSIRTSLKNVAYPLLYWSSTNRGSDSSKAWGEAFPPLDGLFGENRARSSSVASQPKSFKNYIRCVKN